MKKIILILVFVTSTLFYGCAKFLNLVPEKDVETIESIFEIKRGAFDFYNSCFSALNMGISVGDCTTDPSTLLGGEYAVAEFARKGSKNTYLGEVLSISDGNQNTNDPFCDLWTMVATTEQPLPVYTCIRYCNIFIENIDIVNDMSMVEKSNWKAEIKCLKALYYFEMVKRYGPIVLVPHNIPTNVDVATMQIPRSPIDECFAEIVKLLDEAIPNLLIRNELPSKSKNCFSKEAALAYKARVLLYAASPLFNGNSEFYSQFKNRDGKLLFNQKDDREKWRLAGEAADEAIRFAENNGIRLNKGNATEKSAILNTMVDIRNSTMHTDRSATSEWIFVQVARAENHQFLQPFYKVGEKYHDPMYSYGLMAPNIATVELFYTDNGLPITKDKTWLYGDRYKMGKMTNTIYTDIVELNTNVLNLHLRREPRFYTNIVSQGIYDTFNNEKVRVEPYKGQSRGTMSDNFNDGTVLQNITGYWSKKFIPTKSAPGSMSDVPVLLMRLSDLYLMQAEAWNEYSGPSEKVYDAIDAIRERAGIPPIRQAWQQNSTSPDEIKTKEGLRNAIRQERMIEFVFEGHHCWDLRRWKIAETALNRVHTGWNILGTDAKSFYNNFTKPIVVSKKAKFVSPRDYFWPIRSEEIMISNIVQNPGW